MLKNILLGSVLFASSTALADMCFIVEDAYTPAAYRVVYHGALAGDPLSVTGVTLSQIRHSDHTAAVAALTGSMLRDLPMRFMEEPNLRRGRAHLAGYQNGSFIEMRISGDFDRITIWHRFVTTRGDEHTHIAGDVRPCLTDEFIVQPAPELK